MSSLHLFFLNMLLKICLKEKKEGMIVFVYSVTCRTGHEDETIYTMTKFSQRGISQAIDKELRSQGIKTCIMCLSATKYDFEIGFGTTKEGVVKTILRN